MLQPSAESERQKALLLSSDLRGYSNQVYSALQGSDFESAKQYLAELHKATAQTIALLDSVDLNTDLPFSRAGDNPAPAP